MKKTTKTIETLENLIKNFETLTDDAVNEIVHCEDVDVTTLSDREKFACLVFEELQKALDTKSYKLLLDCNYPQSNMHNKSDKQLQKGQEPQWLVDYYRLVSKEGSQKSLIQLYTRINLKSGKCKFNLYTSCAKDNLAQFLSLRDELQFVPVTKKGGEVAKTTRRMDVDYTEVVDVCKAVCAVLLNTSKKAKEDTTEEDANE